MTSNANGNTQTTFDPSITTSFAVLIAADDANIVDGDDGDNTLVGTDGDDTINGLAGNDTISGGDGDDIIDGGQGADVIDGGDGIDTLTYANSSAAIFTPLFNTATLTGGDAAGDKISNIEIIIGSAFGDQMEAANSNELHGGGGNDVLISRGNLDLFGDEGDDKISVNPDAKGRLKDSILDGGAGTDTLEIAHPGIEDFTDNTLSSLEKMTFINQISGDSLYTFTADQIDGFSSIILRTAQGVAGEIELQILMGDQTSLDLSDRVQNGVAADHITVIGDSDAETITGSHIADEIDAGGGNDKLDGGAGADTLVGGTGDDIYVVDNAGDVVTEDSDAGTDTVEASISFTLGTNVENLILTGADNIDATGNDVANHITGNSGNNALNGAGGNDTLDGGAGIDAMTGGLGDDIYIVDETGDVVTEASDEGTDLVQASASYTLGANIENLTLTGTDNLDATGNDLANVITGNTGDNILDGAAGADTLQGGAGNDTYIVDDSGDVVIEDGNAGIDTVRASFSYTLGTNFENLVLTGTDDINATGNNVANKLIGNSGDNTLSGAAGNDTLNGGAGADEMIGGKGDDTYIVDDRGDVVTERSNQGTDTIRASVSGTLGANIENLVLTGTANATATGNNLDNILTGNAGANKINGGLGKDTLSGGSGNDILTGGAGIDALTGGKGADKFVFAAGDTAAKDANADTIFDFKAKDGDRIDLHLIDANEIKSGNQAFHFIGTDAFSGAAGELRYEKAAEGTFIYGDTDGDHKVDFAIHLDDAAQLQSDMFIL